MSNIKRWSRQNAPNEVRAAAAASAGIDMDTDSGSGSGGGAMEARLKALEDDNAKLRQEMGGVVSSVTDLVTTVKEMGTNMNMGFAQLMQANQQGSAALLARIQGTDASVAMLGHAVAGMAFLRRSLGRRTRACLDPGNPPPRDSSMAGRFSGAGGRLPIRPGVGGFTAKFIHHLKKKRKQ